MYDNYEKELRRKIINLKYDLAELEQAYKEKEEEKRNELTKNISILKENLNELQKKYNEEKENFEKELEYTMECKKKYYENISNNLIMEIQDLDMKKVSLETTIEKLKKEAEDEELKRIPEKKGKLNHLTKVRSKV